MALRTTHKFYSVLSSRVKSETVLQSQLELAQCVKLKQRSHVGVCHTSSYAIYPHPARANRKLLCHSVKLACLRHSSRSFMADLSVHGECLSVRPNVISTCSGVTDEE